MNTIIIILILLFAAATIATSASREYDTRNNRKISSDDININNTGSKTKRTIYRIFQTIPHEPSTLSKDELMNMERIIRSTQAMIFAPSSSSSNGGQDDDIELVLDIYTPSERREYLVQRGNSCHPSHGEVNDGSGINDVLKNVQGGKGLEWYDVLSRYDSLMSAAATFSTNTAANNNNNNNVLEQTAIELFKYCILYNGDGNAYWKYDEQLLVPYRDIIQKLDVNYAVKTQHHQKLMMHHNNNNIDNDGNMHDSFLSISPYNPAKYEISSMIRVLLETSNEVLMSNPLLLSSELHRLIIDKKENVQAAKMGIDNVESNDVIEKNDDRSASSWTLLYNSCIPLADLDVLSSSSAASSSGVNTHSDGDVSFISKDSNFATDHSFESALEGLGSTNIHRRMIAHNCPRSKGGYCCLTFLPGEKGADSDRDATQLTPVMALHHPLGGQTPSQSGERHSKEQKMPYKLQTATGGKNLKLGGVPESDLPYISTVRLVRNNTKGVHYQSTDSKKALKFPTHPVDMPNFFDILFENDCLPYSRQCHHCLKDVSNESPLSTTTTDGEETIVLATENACSVCHLECPCYCDVLCKVRPPPKPVTRTYSVKPPAYRKEPNRLVPKIIHQTWFEPVTSEKYPNMSRLIESWKKSGWEYYFYDDDTAGEFLGSHFPPEILEAYESITPGAFKADLFRYCVLLIRGGVYADMDVLLQTNLDDAIANDIGFMTPIDEPGIDVGHRSCLWNGLIASAPGHPFLARTIEIVVNNIRNRFTSVDYDDMLCPNPILSVSHTVDTLFTCGPCILGAGINNLLGRHMQTEFETGDVQIWQGDNDAVEAASVDHNDQRLLIPGRTVILEQNKNDMGAHRFTWTDRHLIIAATDMPDYDDRPPSKEHYSKTHEKAGVYGMRKLYTDTRRANEEIRIIVEPQL